MAWTTDREKAEWFARQYGRFAGYHLFRESNAYACDIEPDGVLARITQMRHEREIVVDPARLPPLTKATIVYTAEVEPDDDE